MSIGFLRSNPRSSEKGSFAYVETASSQDPCDIPKHALKLLSYPANSPTVRTTITSPSKTIGEELL